MIGVVLILCMCYVLDHNASRCQSQPLLMAMGVEAGQSKLSTLNGLGRWVEDSETVPASQKRYLRSAVKRARVLVADGAEDVRLEPKALLRWLDQLSPAMADMLPQSFANFKSRVRTALRYAAPHLAPARSH